MPDGRKTYAQLLVEERTGREVGELLRDLYLDQRLTTREIAAALSAKGAPISHSLVRDWLRDMGISRDDRPAVAL